MSTAKVDLEIAEQISEKAWWVKAYDVADATAENRKFPEMFPNAEVRGVMTNKSGTATSFAFGQAGNLANAIPILEDGSRENISKNLGEQHKVENFYNNILTPNNPAGDVTIDTHAVGAGVIRPTSQKSIEVEHNFGGAPPGESFEGVNRIDDGVKGLYGIYADAYRKAAAKLGIQPRELQSITWEGIRDLFPATFKADEANKTAVQKIWSKYGKGKATLDVTRKAAADAAGGFQEPAWAKDSRSRFGVDEASRNAADTGEVPASSLLRETAGGTVSGRGRRLAPGVPKGARLTPAQTAQSLFQQRKAALRAR